MKFAILAASITAARVIRPRKGEQWYYTLREETDRKLYEENKQSAEDKE